MSDVIKLLPDSVANQIAAGEVIQRPASVIKELVENAVDAGATDIRIFVKDAGRTLIQVVDNGKGMSETDARMAFERHATSKIRRADDLFSLHTMGFRGEALPSICAVSQVELRTRLPENPLGTHLVINGSLVETQEPCTCDAGTNIMVKNIFFNVPVRRKFLKSDNVELSNIMREFERLALVNNHIRMSIDTGTRLHDLRAATFKQRIADIWKNSLDLHLLPIEVDTSLIKISGFVSRPEFARRRNPLQYLIVNGRNMRHPYFHSAIIKCFEPLIAPDTQPCYFLKFTVDPSSIDVNIHPTKNEIKFEYEHEIWPILQASVRASLGKFGAVPSIDFNSDVLPVDPLPAGVLPERPTLDIPEGYNPFEEERKDRQEAIAGFSPFERNPGSNYPGGNYASHGYSGKSYTGSNIPKKNDTVPRNWDSLYADFMNSTRGNTPEGATSLPEGGKQMPEAGASLSDFIDSIEGNEEPTLPEMENTSQPGTFCMQHAQRYIITTSREGLLVIDQHRAHVRILYEEYLRRVTGEEQVAQSLMFPESIELDPEHQVALKEVEEELVRLGFTLEYVEDDRWCIRTIPAMLRDADIRDVILRLLDSVCEDGLNYGQDGNAGKPGADMLSRMALVMARSAAIQGGRKLSVDEMEHLIGELFSLPDPAYTPNGNKVYILLDDHRLDSLLK